MTGLSIVGASPARTARCGLTLTGTIDAVTDACATPEAVAGPAVFAKALEARRYFTGNVDAYLRAFVRLVGECRGQ